MKDLIPVRITTGRHKGLVVWHTRAELERLLKNVDVDAARLLGDVDAEQPDQQHTDGDRD